MLHSRFIRPSSNRRTDLHTEVFVCLFATYTKYTFYVFLNQQRPASPTINGLTNGHQYNHTNPINQSHNYNQLQSNHHVQANYSSNVEPALNQLLRCVESMRVDLQQINNRITIVERSLGDVKQLQLTMQQLKQQQMDDHRNKHHKKVVTCVNVNVLNYSFKTNSNRSKIAGYAPNWWPFAGISPTWMAVLILWPLIAKRLLAARRRR